MSIPEPHTRKIANDVLCQIKLAVNLPKNKHHIGVYVARHNLTPVIDEVIQGANQVFSLDVSSLDGLQDALKRYYRISLDIWQKPEPFNDKNFLTLTIGGLTAIIFDYEN